MNYLAHIYLSGNEEQVVVGNFMGDFVKGNQVSAYPEQVQRGIKLHRLIDEFTDHHPKVLEDIRLIKPQLGRYTPIAIDIFYDYLLAKHWQNYSSEPLLDFTQSAYKTIANHSPLLPERCKHMFTYMKRDNWLYNYQYKEGIHRALTGLSRRTQFDSKLNLALPILEEHEQFINNQFISFFTDLQNNCISFLK
jgi:acyl carrier protein phosphodiesterase